MEATHSRVLIICRLSTKSFTHIISFYPCSNFEQDIISNLEKKLGLKEVLKTCRVPNLVSGEARIQKQIWPQRQFSSSLLWCLRSLHIIRCGEVPNSSKREQSIEYCLKVSSFRLPFLFSLQEWVDTRLLGYGLKILSPGILHLIPPEKYRVISNLHEKISMCRTQEFAE